ncbi:RimK family alpha-L-glutamate ligase [[Eubacterium] cellulosolvens]
MTIGILTRNENSFSTVNLKEAFQRRNTGVFCFNFKDVVAYIKDRERFFCKGVDLLRDLSGILVRPIGRGSLEEVIFQVNILHRLSGNGMVIVNSPKAIEIAVDKYYTLSLLKANNIPVPDSVVTENLREALRGFKRLKEEVVVKPLFGSRGIGISYFNDKDTVERILRTLDFHRHVLYLQRYIPHGKSDLRIFIVGNEVAASMKRVSDTWKNNISQGAKPVAIKVSGEIEDLAFRAVRALGCEIAGVDIIEAADGPMVLEVNSQPGWRGIQQVSEVNIAEKIADYLIQKVKNS